MPDFGSATFSQNDSSNNSGTMPSWSGSAAPSTLDDAGRALQGAATREWNWRSYTLTATGTSDAKVLSYSVAPAAYYNGQRFAFIANTTNTASATLNVNSLGAKTINKDVSGTLTNLSASDMVAGMFVEVAYNTSGDCFVWVNQGNVASASSNTFTANQVISVTDNTNAALRVTQLGTGLALRIEDSTNPDSSPFVIDASGNVGIGTSSPLALLHLNSGAADEVARFEGTSQPFISLYDSGVRDFYIQDTASAIAIYGETSKNLSFYTNATLRFTIDTNGNALNVGSGGLGYGTGSGGTVTQITSKSTGVTINKTNGTIVTTGSALAGNTTVQFSVTNSTVAATDTVLVQLASGDANTGNNYQVWVGFVTAGSFVVTLLNRSGGSRSETLTLNFSIIKAVTS